MPNEKEVDYITVLEGALAAIKEGRDSSSFDRPMAESKERLGQNLKRYE